MLSFATVFASALAVLPVVRGIQFSAVQDTSVGSDVTVKWTSVDTDPSVFSLYLWNFGVFPPYYESLAVGVNTTAGTTSVHLPCDVPGTSGTYQFSAINGTNVYVIYAQSKNFTVSTGDCVSPVTTTSTCSAKTVTLAPTCTYGSNLTYSVTATATSGISHPTNKTVATVSPTISSSSKPSTIPTSLASPLGASWSTVLFGLITCLALL